MSAIFRPLHTELWNDIFFEDLTPEDKLFFICLLTNPKTTQIGIYQISIKNLSNWTGYNHETVEKLISRFEDYGKVKYNRDTKELAIKHWGKYNLKNSGKPMVMCCESQLKKVKDFELIPYVTEHIKNDNIKEIFSTFYNISTGRVPGVDEATTGGARGVYGASENLETEQNSNESNKTRGVHGAYTGRGEELIINSISIFIDTYTNYKDLLYKKEAYLSQKIENLFYVINPEHEELELKRYLNRLYQLTEFIGANEIHEKLFNFLDIKPKSITELFDFLEDLESKTRKSFKQMVEEKVCQ